MISFEIKGGLFSAELIEDLSSRQGQTPDDFGLSAGQRVSDEASRVMAMAKNQWMNFKQVKERLHPEQSGISETRSLWIIPLLSILDYELQYHKANETIGENSFNISHRTTNKDQLPVHISSFRETLDQNPDHSRGNRNSAHVHMQEYLNHTEHLYGIITNGLKLRILRDHHRLTGIQYLEWDLEQLMEENDLASFTAMYRTLHASRMPARQGDDSLLEQYHQHSIEEGHRVRDKLKNAVYKSLQLLGNGFLQHKDNDALREAIASGEISAIAYSQSLRTLLYRLLFLFVAEDRKLVFTPGSSPENQVVYGNCYSLNRFRNLAESYIRANERHSDVWEQLKATFRLFEEEQTGEPLAISPLGGELFAPDALGAIRSARINNKELLKAIDLLSRFEQQHDHRIRINYKRINVEEFGAVYESLLELNPKVSISGTGSSFQFIEGESRKGTGAYYTHQDLVKQLLKTTLEPVIKERLAKAEENITDPDELKQRKIDALLSITVCDPACGSGHFLLAAARALATELAYLKAPKGVSINDYEHEAMREVIEHCIYGVDINPDAAELCRLVLWIEAHQAGKPITYLDHKIRCGNSLVGWLGALKPLIIPDEAFKPIPGDDKVMAKRWQIQNARNKHKTLDLPFEETIETSWGKSKSLFEKVEQQPVNTLEDYWRKKAIHHTWAQNEKTAHKRTLLNIWTYAFFQAYEGTDRPIVINDVLKAFQQGELDSNAAVLKTVEAEAKAARFFHWPLEFPDVFERGGFDAILGNPPWAQIMLKEKQFFAGRKPEIVNAQNAAERKRLIAALPADDPDAQAYYRARRYVDSIRKYVRASRHYELTSGGRVNTYSVFSERALHLISPKGRAGTIVPTGIATDHTNRHFFAHLIEHNRLVSLFDFENRDGLFPEVHRSFKSCLLTLRGFQNTDSKTAEFGFYANQVSDLSDSRRVFELTKEEFLKLNPNTKTCPVFRTNIDFQLTKKLLNEFPVIDNNGVSPWGVKFVSMFNMSSDSKHFQLRLNFYEVAHELPKLRLYEAKMFWHYNHRFNSFRNSLDREESVHRFNEIELVNPENLSQSFYEIHSELVKRRMDLLMKNYNASWFLGFRQISATTNARTFINSVLPNAAFGHSCVLVRNNQPNVLKCAFVASLSSLVFDYACRQKMSGNNVSLFIIKQLPIIPPEQFTETDLQFLVPRVLELTYTAWDLQAFADDVWKDADEPLRQLIQQRWEANQALINLSNQQLAHFAWPKNQEPVDDQFPYPPFRWDRAHRHRVQSELDAFYAYKYGLTTEELKYILDPKLSKLAGETQEERDAFPGETFRVLRDKEEREYNEYRTARLVLEAWEQKPWERPGERIDQVVSVTPKKRMRDYALNRGMVSVIARVIQRNEHPRYTRLLGKTKMEKVLHLIEAETSADFGRIPERLPYGPADLTALDEATEEGKKQDAFVQYPKDPKNPEFGYNYLKKERFSELIHQFEQQFPDSSEIDRIIDLFVPLNRTESELVATVYAAWNNLLINGENLENDDQIITESHEWSPEKKSKFCREDFIKPLHWLRSNNLIPKGEGMVVE